MCVWIGKLAKGYGNQLKSLICVCSLPLNVEANVDRKQEYAVYKETLEENCQFEVHFKEKRGR